MSRECLSLDIKSITSSIHDIKSPPITINMALAFLCCTHKRLGAASVFHGLSADIMRALFLGWKARADNGMGFPFHREDRMELYSWDQYLRAEIINRPMHFTQIQPFAVSPNKNLFGPRSLSVDWLKHVFNMTLMPFPEVPWSLQLDFGVPMMSGVYSIARDWELTRLHYGCRLHTSCACTMPFKHSARASRALSSMVYNNKKRTTTQLRRMQEMQDNYHELFYNCTRRFRMTWMYVRDPNSNFMLSEPTFEDMGVLNPRCKQTMDSWVLRCLHDLWGRHNCDMYVRVRTREEGLQIFVFGRNIVPEQVLQSHLFDVFRNELKGRQLL